MILRALFLASAVGLTASAQKPTAQKSPKKPAATPSTAVAPEKASEGADRTVVVYNDKDPDAATLARYYASKRGIPKDQIVAISCATTEEISRKEYDTDIAAPLRKVFLSKQWWKLQKEEDPNSRVETTRIRYLALIRGIPLKIRSHFEPYEGDKPIGIPEVATHNEAAVDADVAVLGVGTRQISGFLNNPYYRSVTPIEESEFTQLLLVCRLDAPTPDLVRRMIDDSIATEKTGLRGLAYIDARGITTKGLVEGDKWLLAAAETARRKGLPVILDTGEGLYPTPYPMSRAAVYLGWYSETVNGPFIRPDFRFERGAVAVHIHSFSASTVRDPRRGWCAPLISAGAAVTLGNVYEPYLGLTTSLNLFFERLRSGTTFAESCYQSQPALSWMSTFVGDPLYRPFKAIEETTGEPKNEYDAYRAGARAWYEQGPEAGTALLKAGAQKYSSGVIMEGLGLLQLAAKNNDDAVNSFNQAAMLYRKSDDIVRATIHEVFQLKAMNRLNDAIKVARKQIDRFHKESAADVLRVIEADMTLNATTAKPAATPAPATPLR